MLSEKKNYKMGEKKEEERDRMKNTSCISIILSFMNI